MHHASDPNECSQQQGREQIASDRPPAADLNCAGRSRIHRRQLYPRASNASNGAVGARSRNGTIAALMAETSARPHGLGVAVVFDWALTAQLTTQALAAATGHLGLARDIPAIAGRMIGAGILLGLGEGLRRGVPSLRIVQVALMALITTLGIVSAVVLVTGHGSASLVFSTIVELTYAPWLVWRLLSRETAGWFASTRGRGGAPRTSGSGWVAVLAAWSAVWGIAVAWSQSLS
jgi:hypothetical protein